MRNCTAGYGPFLSLILARGTGGAQHSTFFLLAAMLGCRSSQGRTIMDHHRGCMNLHLAFAAVLVALLAAGPARGQGVPDISGTYWATQYNAKVQLVGGGELPLTPAGKAAYDKNMAGLRNGSISDNARKFC